MLLAFEAFGTVPTQGTVCQPIHILDIELVEVEVIIPLSVKAVLNYLIHSGIINCFNTIGPFLLLILHVEDRVVYLIMIFTDLIPFLGDIIRRMVVISNNCSNIFLMEDRIKPFNLKIREAFSIV